MMTKFFLVTAVLCFIALPLELSAQNLALSAVVTSSGGGDRALGPDNINDGELEGAGNPHWIDPATGSWITLTWPTSQRIGCMWVDTSPIDGRTLSDCDIQTWDGAAFLTVATISGMTDDWSFDFGTVDTTRIRLFTPGIPGRPLSYEIEVYGPGPDCTSLFPATPTPTPTGTWFSPTPTATSECDWDVSSYEHWSMCEILVAPTPKTPRTRALQWDFNDCWYCRNVDNPCFTEPCTFGMYVAVECGNRLSVPLWDTESAGITIKDCELGSYENLYAASTGGWSASGTLIQWQDCTGFSPLWHHATTEIYFEKAASLCGVYRVELIDMGANIWTLFANCGGGLGPGFWVYDSLEEARASFISRPELSISNPVVSGICPDYTVTVDVHNSGCLETDVPVCIETSLGGHWEFIIPAVGPGDTKSGSGAFVAPSCRDTFVLTAIVDCLDVVEECSESGGSAIPCIMPGTEDVSVSIDVYPPVPLKSGVLTWILVYLFCTVMFTAVYLKIRWDN